MPDDALAAVRRAWAERKPGQLIGKGHPAGDFLEAYDWLVAQESEGFLRIEAQLPEHVKNPRGQLFGGFTPTYVDLVALFTVRAGNRHEPTAQGGWLATTNMRIDYFEPITGPSFVMESRQIVRRGRTNFVETRFLDPDGKLAVFAVTPCAKFARIGRWATPSAHSRGPGSRRVHWRESNARRAE